MNEPQRVIFTNKPILFEDFKKELKCPIVIYADFEALVIPCADEDESGPIHLHVPCSYMWMAVDWNGDVIYQKRETCENAAERLLESLKDKCDFFTKYIVDSIQPQPQIVHNEEWAPESECHICKKHINFLQWSTRHHDHDHLTGEYRGIAHRECNMKYLHQEYLLYFII